ncbi:hypothetical protein HA50_25040 [Pantoea cypripedii]|uniref:Uncharacterized protein n=2 Tax=Pantoea cypripedii TaxID=55209 RepID=A0A1X1ELZ9_PANCY|nr:hypothetical protein HA50_25040 [Pantoea cypripedii]
MTERFYALGEVVKDFTPGTPIDFSGIEFGEMDISQAVTSGLKNQWTDAGVEKYLNGQNENNFLSFITNNSQLTPDEKLQFMDGVVNSLKDSGIGSSNFSNSTLNDFFVPVDASNHNILNSLNHPPQSMDSNIAEARHIQNLQRLLDCSPVDRNESEEIYTLPSIPAYRHLDGPGFNKNKYFAESANAIVRDRFKQIGTKSENKMRINDPNSVTRITKAWFDGNKAIEHKRKAWCGLGTATGHNRMPPFYPDNTLAMKLGAGNCGEMSGIADQIINKSGGYSRQYQVDKKGTHAFTLVGKPSPYAKDSIHFSDYDNCWVVDPWANIVCKASEYTETFIKKMDEWTNKGKAIRTNEDWVFANNPEWVNAVVEGSKHQLLPESVYSDPGHEDPEKELTKELPPPVREALDNLDPQKESTTTEDMQKALKKAKELGPDTFLQWLDEADVAKRLADGILSGQSVTSCGLLLEDLANDLLDLLKDGAVPAKRICEALFPPQAKEFIMAVIPQLMLKPAGVRLTRLMEQLAQKDEVTRSDLIDSMSKRSCVPSIERANSEKSDFYERVESVYDRSVFPKITAAQKGKLRDHLPLAFYKQSSDTLENGNLMSVKHRRIASFTKIRNDAVKLAQAMNSDELGHRTITPEMLRETQQNDNKNYEKQRNAIVAYRKIYIGNKISSDIISTAKQHMPEPEWVRNLNNLTSEIVAFANESNAVKEAEWESRVERIEAIPGSSDVATDGLFIRAMAGAAIEGASRDAESMMRPAGRDITSMIGKGELMKAIDLNDLRNRLFDKFRGLWQETFKVLEGGVNAPYDGLLYTMLNIWETHMHLLALPNYAPSLKEVNEINTKMIHQLVRDGWLNSNNNPALDRLLARTAAPAPVPTAAPAPAPAPAPTAAPAVAVTPVVEKPVSKEPERQISAESASTGSPPKKRSKARKQVLLAE